MRRKQNIIIFSAGESVRNGNIAFLQAKLEERGVACFDWRSLFSQAHNMDHIALLPNLSKKIPTFDFALIFAEGVDTVKLRGNEEHMAIRDNVIFELGLCVMALGVERVILLADESVRIPEDLVGVGKIGVEYVTFSSQEKEASINKIGQIIEKKAETIGEQFTSQLDEIIKHIHTNAELISPVFVGASVSSAEAYFLNFVIRFFENIDKGFSYKNCPEKVYPFPDELKLCIYIPASVDMLTRSAISEYYAKHGYKEFVIQDAGIRGLFFNGILDSQQNSLVIADIPSSITASYSVVNSVLNIDSDAEYDNLAEARFIAKEMDIFAFALNKLLSREVASKRLAFIRDDVKRERIIHQLSKVTVEIIDITI